MNQCCLRLLSPQRFIFFRHGHIIPTTRAQNRRRYNLSSRRLLCGSTCNPSTHTSYTTSTTTKTGKHYAPDPRVQTWAYLTDVEGNIDFFKRAVSASPHLDYDEASNRLNLGKGAGFVYGGDLFDKGPGDIRLSRALVDLKRRHPNRCFLIMGNRDVNKMKLAAELDPTDVLDRPAESMPAPFWAPDTTSYAQFLSAPSSSSSPPPSSSSPSPSSSSPSSSSPSATIAVPVSPTTLSSPPSPQTPSLANRLEYMCKFTMGAPNLVAFRKQELWLLSKKGSLDREAEFVSSESTREDKIATDNGANTTETITTSTSTATTTSAAAAAAAATAATAAAATATVPAKSLAVSCIDDDAVTGSFLEGVLQSDGVYRAYLESSQLAVVIGDTLFVHGAVTDRSVGFIPGAETRCGVFEEPAPGMCTRGTYTVQEWASRLNEFAFEAVAAWARDPGWDENRERRNGEQLMAYCHGAAVQRRSCMVSTFCDDNGNLCAPDQSVCDYLINSGIGRVITGHKPAGDLPGIMRVNGIEVLTADTSFSDTSQPCNRGIAHHALSLHVRQGMGGGGNGGRRTTDSEVAAPSSNWVEVTGVRADGCAYSYTLPSTVEGKVVVVHDGEKKESIEEKKKELNENETEEEGEEEEEEREEREEQEEKKSAYLVKNIHTGDFADTLVGRQLSGGWWVRAPLYPAPPSRDTNTNTYERMKSAHTHQIDKIEREREKYLVARGEGYNMLYKTLSLDEVLAAS